MANCSAGRAQDVFLAPEVVIEKTVGHTCLFGDLLHGRTFEALFEKQSDGGLDKRLTTLFGRGPLCF